jgi:hypothetical protein
MNGGDLLEMGHSKRHKSSVLSPQFSAGLRLGQEIDQSQTSFDSLLAHQELVSGLIEQQATLEVRLENGVKTIEEARNRNPSAPARVIVEWETYWIKLLRRYELVSNQLRELDYYPGSPLYQQSQAKRLVPPSDHRTV